MIVKIHQEFSQNTHQLYKLDHVFLLDHNHFDIYSECYQRMFHETLNMSLWSLGKLIILSLNFLNSTPPGLACCFSSNETTVKFLNCFSHFCTSSLLINILAQSMKKASSQELIIHTVINGPSLFGASFSACSLQQ